jgi:hypothetical protein
MKKFTAHRSVKQHKQAIAIEALSILGDHLTALRPSNNPGRRQVASVRRASRTVNKIVIPTLKGLQ